MEIIIDLPIGFPINNIISLYMYIYILRCCLQAGLSALMYASALGHAKVVVNLISAGANLNLQNKVRLSCLTHG